MTSNRDRQRAAARARLEREMAYRAERARRRRRIQLIVAAVASVIVVVAAVWIVVAVTDNDDKDANADPSASATPTDCKWEPKATPSDPAQGPPPNSLRDVGTPPTSGEPRSGKQLMTVTSNLGVIKIALNNEKAPCTSASFAYLAGKQFFDNSKCHRAVQQAPMYIVQCGDPSASGFGGPTYQFGDENLPTDRRPAYRKGSVAMANGGPGTNGSQFFIVYRDTDLKGDYTLFGEVVEGLDLVEKAMAAGVVAADPQNPSDGAPKTEIKFLTVTVSGPNAEIPSPVPPTPSPTPAPATSGAAPTSPPAG